MTASAVQPDGSDSPSFPPLSPPREAAASVRTMTPFLPAEIRVQFPGSQDKVYLNIAETTLIPVSSADAARAYVEHALMGTGDKTAHRASVERCREGLAELLGSHPDEVAITKNVSEALNLFASSLPWKAGDNVVFCPELEHPNNVFLWYNRAS